MKIFVSGLVILYLSLAAALSLAPSAGAQPSEPLISCIDGHLVHNLSECPIVVHHTPGGPGAVGGGGGGLLGGLLGGALGVLSGGLLFRRLAPHRTVALVGTASRLADLFWWSHLGRYVTYPLICP